jgi:hypothetical protein
VWCPNVGNIVIVKKYCGPEIYTFSEFPSAEHSKSPKFCRGDIGIVIDVKKTNELDGAFYVVLVVWSVGIGWIRTHVLDVVQ